MRLCGALTYHAAHVCVCVCARDLTRACARSELAPKRCYRAGFRGTCSAQCYDPVNRYCPIDSDEAALSLAQLSEWCSFVGQPLSDCMRVAQSQCSDLDPYCVADWLGISICAAAVCLLFFCAPPICCCASGL